MHAYIYMYIYVYIHICMYIHYYMYANIDASRCTFAPEADESTTGGEEAPQRAKLHRFLICSIFMKYQRIIPARP